MMKKIFFLFLTVLSLTAVAQLPKLQRFEIPGWDIDYFRARKGIMPPRGDTANFSPAFFSIMLDSASNVLCVSNGTAWIPIGTGSGGSQNFQQVLDKGRILDKQNTIHAGSYYLDIDAGDSNYIGQTSDFFLNAGGISLYSQPNYSIYNRVEVNISSASINANTPSSQSSFIAYADRAAVYAPQLQIDIPIKCAGCVLTDVTGDGYATWQLPTDGSSEPDTLNTKSPVYIIHPLDPLLHDTIAINIDSLIALMPPLGNFANTDLTATGNRTHDFATNFLKIGNASTVELNTGVTSGNYRGFFANGSTTYLETISGGSSEKASTLDVGSEFIGARVDDGGANTKIFKVTPLGVTINYNASGGAGKNVATSVNNVFAGTDGNINLSTSDLSATLIPVSMIWDTFYYKIKNNILSPGTTYKITDRGDRGIFLTASGIGSIFQQGARKMLCPKHYQIGTYDGNVWTGVWDTARTFSVGELCIYYGFVYQNLTGADGTRSSPSNHYEILDAVNWQLVPKSSFSNNEYEEKDFSIEYNWKEPIAIFGGDTTFGFVSRQWDSRGNIMSFGGSNDLNTSSLIPYPQFNDCTDWNIPEEGWDFYDNQTVQVSGNVSLHIYRNHGSSGIVRNRADHIRDNTIHNWGDFAKNEATDITENEAIEIYNNHMKNGGSITNNHCFSNYLSGNSCDDISYNKCGGVNGNDQTGDAHLIITENYNTGLNGVYNVHAVGTGTVTISNNTNNGNITGTKTAPLTISDTIVDK